MILRHKVILILELASCTVVSHIVMYVDIDTYVVHVIVHTDSIQTGYAWYITPFREFNFMIVAFILL